MGSPPGPPEQTRPGPVYHHRAQPAHLGGDAELAHAGSPQAFRSIPDPLGGTIRKTPEGAIERTLAVLRGAARVGRGYGILRMAQSWPVADAAT